MKLPKTRKTALLKGSNYYQSNKKCKNGHTSKKHVNAGCYECSRNQVKKYDKNNPGKRLAKNKKDQKNWYLNNPEKAKNAYLKNKYGLTLQEYNKIKENQNNKCAICEHDDPKGRGDFHVDHCHKTGKVRGLLCHFCNIALGNFNDSPKNLKKALKYLRRYQ